MDQLSQHRALIDGLMSDWEKVGEKNKSKYDPAGILHS